MVRTAELTAIECRLQLVADHSPPRRGFDCGLQFFGRLSDGRLNRF
jgi:hypothetical protein